MSNRELIAQSAYKKIYREENKVVKVFAEGFPKSEVLNEALNTARVEEIALNVGKILGYPWWTEPGPSPRNTSKGRLWMR